ncbi:MULTISPECIES: hypothetical protein [unclassified Nocardioides]|uniref:hypothetical protein n=1 Tax=unclassified Nocardioides TaxID=2615069 RepID=UPI0012E39D03|nr:MULTISPECIES: hypothetical protein [unclassified Nocardioides]
MGLGLALLSSRHMMLTSRKSLSLTVAMATAVVALSATPAHAAIGYRTDPSGDATGYSSTITTRANADFLKTATWKSSGRVYVKAWFRNLTSGMSGSVHFVGLIGSRTTEVGLSRGTGGPVAYLIVGSTPRCASSMRRTVDLTKNSVTISVPTSCMPAGTWRPAATSVAFKNNTHHAKDRAAVAAVFVR